MERATVDTKKGLDAATVAQAFVNTARLNPDRVAIRTRGGEREISWAEYGEQVDRFALGLRELGLKRGDVFGLMLTNRPEFHIADSAAMSLGATPFSLYQTLTPDQIAYQLSDSGADIVVTEPTFLENVRAALEQAPGVRHLILVDAPEGNDAIPFDDLLATEGDRADIDRERDAVEPDDLLTLIYTSGTTGPPRGSSSRTTT